MARYEHLPIDKQTIDVAVYFEKVVSQISLLSAILTTLGG